MPKYYKTSAKLSLDVLGSFWGEIWFSEIIVSHFTGLNKKSFPLGQNLISFPVFQLVEKNSLC